MIINLYKFGDPNGEMHETSRVTMLEDGSEKFRIPGRVLVLGSLPRTLAIPLQEIQWFWIEEN